MHILRAKSGTHGNIVHSRTLHCTECLGTAPAGAAAVYWIVNISQNTYKLAACFWPEKSSLAYPLISSLHAFVFTLMAGRQDCQP